MTCNYKVMIYNFLLRRTKIFKRFAVPYHYKLAYRSSLYVFKKLFLNKKVKK